MLTGIAMKWSVNIMATFSPKSLYYEWKFFFGFIIIGLLIAGRADTQNVNLSSTIQITGKGFNRAYIEIPVGTILYFNNASSSPIILCGGSHQICSAKESAALKLPGRGLTIAAGKEGAISFFDEDSDTTYPVTLGKLSNRSFSNTDLRVVVSANTTGTGGSSISIHFSWGSSGVPSSNGDDENGGSSGAPSSGSGDGGGDGGDGSSGGGGGGDGE